MGLYNIWPADSMQNYLFSSRVVMRSSNIHQIYIMWSCIIFGRNSRNREKVAVLRVNRNLYLHLTLLYTTHTHILSAYLKFIMRCFCNYRSYFNVRRSYLNEQKKTLTSTKQRKKTKETSLIKISFLKTFDLINNTTAQKN